MPRNESTGAKDPGTNEGIASEDTDADDKNPGDWRPADVTDIRQRLLDGASTRAVAAEMGVDKDVIRTLAKHGHGAGEIGPLQALSTSGRWLPKDALATDGGRPHPHWLFRARLAHERLSGGGS